MTTRAQWTKRMRQRALVLLFLGLALLLGGSFLIAGPSPMLGYVVGAVGIVAIAFGALSGRYATAGPFPRDLEEDGTGDETRPGRAGRKGGAT